MKIVIFAPHPDDELLACGGNILKWLHDGYDVHLIYITDNRALFFQGHVNDQLIEEEARKFRDLTEDEIANIAIKEAEDVAKAYGLKEENIHLFKFHDLDAENNIELGVKLSKEIILGADRIVLPSDHNPHEDHQATHTIAKKAAQELKLSDIEFYVYALYVGIRAPRDKIIRFKISEYNQKLYEISNLYKTQLCFKDTKGAFEYLKTKKYEKFGIFNLQDSGKFYNF